jgi:hypothetical protein
MSGDVLRQARKCQEKLSGLDYPNTLLVNRGGFGLKPRDRFGVRQNGRFEKPLDFL